MAYAEAVHQNNFNLAKALVHKQVPCVKSPHSLPKPWPIESSESTLNSRSTTSPTCCRCTSTIPVAVNSVFKLHKLLAQPISGEANEAGDCDCGGAGVESLGNGTAANEGLVVRD
ncbi:hypothetical protein C1H46_023410 [Malus baccata]|uniref:Uncharacterized protein n=1 Tax=Malus baccata TaxID=106549 RepID=A0A540LWZ0_MALBA|nr:hypothetical protein C1H46_023410 [Malus baccata]